MTQRALGVCLAVVSLSLSAGCGGGGGGGGGPPERHALSVAVSGATGGGRVTSAPAGIDCPGTCSADFDAGASVTLTQAPAAGHVFTGWSGACSGAATCAVALSADRAVGAGFDGPTDVTVATPYGHQGFPLSLLAGEGRTAVVTTALARGAPGAVTLTATGLPAGVTAAFSPASVAAGGTSTLTITAAAGTAVTPAPASASVVATSAYGTRSAALPLEVRSPRLALPAGVAWEYDGSTPSTTALVSEAVPSHSVGRLVRVDATTGLAVRTVAAGLLLPSGPAGIGLPSQVAVNLPSTFALVASAAGLARVDLATGVLTSPAPALRALGGVALEAGSGLAVVTECGTAPSCSNGALSRVDLATGAVTTLATGLNDPAGVLPYSSGFAVAERGAGRVVLVSEQLPTRVLAEGLDHPSELAMWFDFSLLVTTAGGDVAVVGPNGGAAPFLDLPGGGAAYRGLAVAPWTWSEAIVALRGPDRLARLQLTAVPAPVGPFSGTGRLTAPRAYAYGTNFYPAVGYYLTECGAGGEAGCALTGRLVQLWDEVRPVATGLNDPCGVSPGPFLTRYTLLVAERGAGRLLLVDVETPEVTVVATGLPRPWDVELESSGTTALVSAADGVYRVDLGTGAAVRLAELSTACGLANEGRGLTLGAPPFNVAYVAEACPPQITAIDLDTGARTPQPIGVEDPRGVRFYSEPVVADAGQGGRLFSGALAFASSLGPVADGALTGTGGTSWLSGDQLFSSVGDLTSRGLAERLVRPAGLSPLSPDFALLFADCGADAACQGTGRLVRLDLGDESQTVLFTGLTAPAAAVRESSLKVLAADCETASSCATAGRLSRVEGSSRTTVAGGLADPAWIAIEASGTTALVAERAAGRITRVQLGTGTKTTVATGLAHPRQVELETGGATALVAEDGRLTRLVLATGATTEVVAWDLGRFAVDPDRSRLILLPRTDAPGPAQFLASVDLASGLVTVQGSRLTHAPDSGVVRFGTLYVAERRDVTGAIRSLTPP